MLQSVKVPLLVRDGLMNFQKHLLVSKPFSVNLFKEFAILFHFIDTHSFLYASSFSLDGSRQYLFFSLVLVYVAFQKSLFIKGAWLPLGSFFLKVACLSIASKKFSFGFVIYIWIIRRHRKVFVLKIMSKILFIKLFIVSIKDDFWLQFWRFGFTECRNKFMVITQTCFSCISLKKLFRLISQK